MEEAARRSAGARGQIEGMRGSGQNANAGFLTSLTLPLDPLAPQVVSAMLKAGIAAGTGPMAAIGERRCGACRKKAQRYFYVKK